MDKNIINKIKNLSLEQINKNLIFVAILSLLFRTGCFTGNYVPKPFELIVIIIVILTIIDAIKNRKIKEFFYSVPKNTRIALIFLVSSVFIGWIVSILKGITTSFNMILEFGSFMFSLSIFLLIFFYTRNDKSYIKKYFYALLIPVIYIICIVFPGVAGYFNLTTGINFIGFTTNQNIISKMLLVSATSFIVISLFENKNKWLKIFYILVSSCLVSLIFWVASRAALFCLFFGSIFVFLFFSLNNFNYRKFFKSGFIVLLIIFLGFFFTPYSAKQVSLSRFLNLDNVQSDYATNSSFYSKSIRSIIKDSFIIGILKNNKVPVIIEGNKIPETRFQFWPVYFRYILINPLGIGPNTHVELDYIYNGSKISLGPHNSYLEILLWGGFVGLLSFFYILCNAFLEVKNKLVLNFNVINLSLFSIITIMSIVIVANDSLSFPYLWIVLALSLISTKND